MFFLPLLIGILVGVVLMLEMYLLKKRGISPSIIHAYTFTLFLIGVLIIGYGYKVVRGFGGFAYLLLGSPIVILSIITFVINYKDTNKVKQ